MPDAREACTAAPKVCASLGLLKPILEAETLPRDHLASTKTHTMNALIALWAGLLVLASANRAVLTSCEVTAFDTSMVGRSFYVRLERNGFRCPGMNPLGELFGTARFDSFGRARIQLRRVYVHAGGVCASRIVVMSGPKRCMTREVAYSRWSHINGPDGSCRLLTKRCRGDPLVAAPYIDMKCTTPAHLGIPNAGKPREIKLHWKKTLPQDQC